MASSPWSCLFPPANPGETIHGGFTNITLGWGLAVTMGIYIAGKISGAHLNPAVTLAFAVFREFPWRKVLPYSIAQTVGAFAAAALVYWNYLPAFHQVDPRLERTAGVFTTFPAFPALPQAGFLDQLIGTGLLVLLVFAITDEFNSPPGANLTPVLIGLVVVAIGISFGGMHGYAINPARDFGPRLFTVCRRLPQQRPHRRNTCLVDPGRCAVTGRAGGSRHLRFRNSPLLASVAGRCITTSPRRNCAICSSARPGHD